MLRSAGRLRSVDRGSRHSWPVSQLERLCTGARWSEGPVWMHEDDSVLWSDIPNDRMLRWSARDGMRCGSERVGVHQRSRARPRRLAAALQPRLARGVPHGARRQRAAHRRRPLAGQATQRAERHRRQVRWHALVHRPAVRVDHSRGRSRRRVGDRRLLRVPLRSRKRCARSRSPTCRSSRTGSRSRPTSARLYVSDTSAALGREATGKHCIWAFDVVDGRRLANGRKFATSRRACRTGSASTRRAGSTRAPRTACRCSTPDGALLGRIAVPEKVGNVTFGGAAARHALHRRVDVAVSHPSRATRAVHAASPASVSRP